jgi:class 3 adenylate cyclase/tetratricopeptide (TPR) repeat protein
MQCSRCHEYNRDGARFCRECGATLTDRCTACGTELGPGNKYCDNCGALVAGMRALEAAPGRFASPESYTPAHLAKRILTSRTALEGELKQVTVLHADMKGSTEYVANRAPEEARQLLDPILELMMDAVHRYEGTVNQVMGDGIMALFGAPLSYEDHAVRACYSALSMQESIKKYSVEVRRKEGIPLQIRVGMNSGEVYVRSIGSDLHMNYTAQGLTSHLSARMEQMAVPGTILMTSQTRSLAEGHVVANSLGSMLVKGLTDPIEAYELVGACTFRSRLEAISSRRLTNFVGRENEIDQLHQGIDRAQKGHGQIAAVVGEPGVGKSRLIHEFINLRPRNCRILRASAVSYGTANSYLPVTNILKDYFQISTSDNPGEVRKKVTEKILLLDEALLPFLPPLLTLLDLPTDDPELSILAPLQRRQRALEAVKRLLFRESIAQPLLVVLEDLHAIDRETQALVDGLVDSLPTARLLLLVSYRPGYTHSWGSKTYYTQVRIDPLEPEIAREMLNAILGSDPGLDPLKHLLIEKTEGNPLFLEESVRTLVEAGALVGRLGAYSTTKLISELQVPATIESLLTSRIDRLPPGDKRLLQSAAVIGNHAPLGILQTLGESTSDDLQQALGRLQASELLYEMRLFPDFEYSFKHALIRDAAYQMLPPDRRRALHSAVLVAGEQYYASQSAEKADWLAVHALGAKVWDRATLHLRVAAARAIARAANRVAAQHLENALIAVDHLSGPDRRVLAIDLRIDLRHALTPLGQVQRTLDHLQTAEGLATELNDKSRLSRVVAFIANCLLLQAKYSESLATGARALQIAQELGDTRLQLAIEMYMARATLCRGERREAILMYRNIIQALDERPSDEFLDLPVLPAVVARNFLATALAEGGAFAEAAAHNCEAARRADVSGLPDSIMWANWSVGLVALIQGDPAKAIRAFDRLLEICSTHDLDVYASRIMAALGCAKARAGQVSEGLMLAEHAVALDASAENLITKSFAVTALSETALLSGELDKALTFATQAVERTKLHGERSAEAYAHWLLATIQSVRALDLKLAADMFGSATTIATELGLQPLLAHCQLGLGDLYERMGSPTEANKRRERGQRLLKELGMKSWFNLERGLSSAF